MTRIQKSTRRVVSSGSRNGLGDIVVTLYPDGTVEMHPKGVRAEDAKVCATWAQLYQWALAARPPKHPRRITRGVV